MAGDLTPETSTAVLRAPEPPDRGAPPTVAKAPRPGAPSRAFTAAGIVIVVILAACCLGLVFRSGAYRAADWLPFVIGVAALACAVAIGGPAVRAGRVQRVILLLFALLALWTTLSISWAVSLGDAWEEINRTLFYAVAIGLVFAAVRWAGPLGLRVLVGIITAVVGVVAVVVLVRLGTDADAVSLLPGGRLNYPITYWNGLACFLMIGFWLALGLANGAGSGAARWPRTGRRLAGQATQVRSAEAATVPQGPPAAGARTPGLEAEPKRRPTASPGATFLGRVSFNARLLRVAQPVLLMLAVVLLELMLLPQSRGALWTFFLVIPLFVVFSPNRFRALADLVIVAIPVVFSWGSLNGVYAAVHNQTAVGPAISSALHAVGYSVLAVLVMWALTYLVERLLTPLPQRIPLLLGAILIVVAVGCAVAGLVWADIHTGGLGRYVSDRWHELVGDTSPSSSSGADSSRFAAFGLNGRLTQWKVATKAFEEHPGLGLGAQNFERYNYLHRTVVMDVRNPHSQPMQLLAEQGIPGLVFYLGFVLAALVWGVAVRFRGRGATRARAPAHDAASDKAVRAMRLPSLRRADSALLAAMLTACLSWFIHSSADWMWQLTALTLPAMMLFAGLIAAGGPGWGASLTRPVADEAANGPNRRHIPAHAHRQARRALWSPRVIAWVAGVLALGVLVSALFPYLSLRTSNLAAGASDPAVMESRTDLAARLDPTAVHPYATRATAYAVAAQEQPQGSSERADDLRLAATTWIDAVKHFPDIWLNNYMAAQALVAARDAATAAGKDADARILDQWARNYLDAARALNPLSPQVKVLEGKL